MHKYLAGQGADPNILDSDCVCVEVVYIEGSISNSDNRQIFTGTTKHFIKDANLTEARWYPFSRKSRERFTSSSGLDVAYLYSYLNELDLPITDQAAIAALLPPHSTVENRGT